MLELESYVVHVCHNCSRRFRREGGSVSKFETLPNTRQSASKHRHCPGPLRREEPCPHARPGAASPISSTAASRWVSPPACWIRAHALPEVGEAVHRLRNEHAWLRGQPIPRNGRNAYLDGDPVLEPRDLGYRVEVPHCCQ